MRRNHVLVLFALAAACGPTNPEHPGIGLYQSDSQAATVCAGASTVQGIDVSYWQGSVNWAQVAASGRQFGYAKATQGNYYADTTFPGNWSGMKAAGLLRGAYHWLDGSVNGTVQADYYLAHVGALGSGDLPPMLDWECNDSSCGNAAAVSAAQDIQAGADFVAEIKAKTGLPTFVYTDPGFWSSIGNPSGFGGDPLWIANYGVSCPDVPPPWSGFVIWQYTSTGGVPGVSGANVDHDEFNGTLSQLQQLGNGGAAACNYPLGHPIGDGTLVNGPCGSGTPALPPKPPACGSIPVGDGLGPGDQVTSCDGRFVLVMQTDGNVVLYAHGEALWNSGTATKGGYLFTMQGDGNLVLYSKAGCALWASNSGGNPGASLAVQSDGNLVVYSASGKPLWSSGTGPIPKPSPGCGKLSPGAGLGPGDQVVSCEACFSLVMQTDGNLVLYRQGHGAIWSSATNGKDGITAVMQTDGNFVLYSGGGCPLWGSGTSGHSGAFLAVQDDGNLVVYDSANQPLWASNSVACSGGCSCLPPPPPPPADAGTPPPADAGTPPPADAGTPPPADAGTPPPADDAGIPLPSRDAGSPAPADAGSPPVDGGEAADAGGSGGLDGGPIRLPDGGASADAGRDGLGASVISGQGCGCETTRGRFDASALLFIGLGLVLRRRSLGR